MLHLSPFVDVPCRVQISDSHGRTNKRKGCASWVASDNSLISKEFVAFVENGAGSFRPGGSSLVPAIRRVFFQ
jgi:hypothetical protein